MEGTPRDSRYDDEPDRPGPDEDVLSEELEEEPGLLWIVMIAVGVLAIIGGVVLYE